MIYCPRCGTANRDKSRFCNECGQKLSHSTGIKCPECGHQNSVQSIFCQECGHRLEAGMPPPELTPEGPSIKGLSLPVKGQEDVDDAPPDEDARSLDDEVPAWLQELSAAYSAGANAGAEGTGEIPTWLAELGVGLSEADDAHESAAPEPAPADGASEPDTLEPSDTDLAGEPGAPEPAHVPPEPTEPDSLEQPSIWPDEMVQEPEPVPAPEVSEPDVPAWLQQLLQKQAASLTDADAEAPAEPAPEGESDWLDESLPKEAMPSESFWPADISGAEPEPATETVPTWLAELHGEPDVPSATSLAHPEPVDEAPPVWLHEVEPEDEPFAAAMVAPAAQEPELEPVEPGSRDEDGEPEAEAIPPVSPPDPTAILETESELVEAELQGWVADLEPESEPRALSVVPEAEPELAEDESPDWVRDLRRGEMAPAPSAALPVADQAVPNLAAEPEPTSREDLPAGELERPSPESAPTEPSEETIPEVVEAPAEPLADATSPKDAPERVPGPARELPAWLGDVQDEDDLELEDHWLMQATPEPLDELPDWMTALHPDAEAPGELEEPVEESMPDWLLTWTEDLLTEGEEELVRADIPEWLWELRPQRALEALNAHPTRGEEKIESHGILAGRKGVLPVEPMMALPPSTDRRSVSSPPQDPSKAELFHKVVTQPPLLRPQVVTRPAIETVPAVTRWLIYLFLLVAVVIPLVWETQFFVRPAVAPGPVQALHDVVAALEPNAPVLVVFDYTPTSSGEMDLIAETVLDHLIDQQARIVALSLSPTGPQLAQIVLDRVVADRPGYTYCEDYVNLGYVPGQVVAPRTLAQTLWEGIPYDHQHRCTGVQGQPLAATDLAVTAGVDSIGDFALIVDLASQQASVRWWIEQVGSQVEGVRLAAAVSAAVEPFIRPYAEATPPQLVGYVAGWPETSDYLGLQGQPRWELEGRLDAQILGLGAIVAVILAGNIAHVLQQAKRRE